MKKCPYCAEEIQDAAVKCRYCNEFLDDEAPGAEPAAPERSGRWGIIVAAGLAFLLFSRGVPFLRVAPLSRRLAGLFYSAQLTVEFPAGDAAAAAGDEAVREAAKIIVERVRQFSGREPQTKLEGRTLSITARGVADVEKLKDLIRRRGALELRLVDDSPAAQRALAALAQGEKIGAPANDILLPGLDGGQFLLSKAAVVSGARVTSARADRAPSGESTVVFKLDESGAGALARLSGANVKKRLAIILDGLVYSAPTIVGRIDKGSALINGRFDADAARELAIVLGSGVLPVPVEVRDAAR